jgi:curved DNA-binding protein
MDFKDYYKILGVDSEADKKAIKTAYRKLARRYHPDVSDHHDAENQFKEVTEAYEVLKDTAKRAEYDEIRQYGDAEQAFNPPRAGNHLARLGAMREATTRRIFRTFSRPFLGVQVALKPVVLVIASLSVSAVRILKQSCLFFLKIRCLKTLKRFPTLCPTMIMRGVLLR